MLTVLLINRVTAVFLVLIGATIVSWVFSHGDGFVEGRYAGLVVIVVAFIKIRLILLDFMDLRHAPPPMRIAMTAWIVVICAALCYLYWWRPVFFGAR
jgi:heme/copper-type cytochrome/quinol oxidase subunit 4